jgi:hypothetical protein
MPNVTQRVEAFRGRQPRLPLHPQEKQVLALVALHLCLLPWMLGTTRPAGQWVSLGLGAVGFGVALRPRIYSGRYVGLGRPYRMLPGLKLRTFPIFWLGFGLLGYMLIQALNPAWLYVWTTKLWWVVPIQHVSWLPTGVSIPFERSNVWRQIVIYAAGWLLTCTVWIGLMRRQSMRILLGVLAANGLGLAILLAVQRVKGDHRIPWPLTAWAPDDLTASFIYENHAGQYFALLAFTALALATWHYDHGRRMLKKSTPGAVLALGALFLGGAVFFTLSRGACLCLAAGAAAFALWSFLWHRRRPSAVSNPAVNRIVAGAFTLFLIVTCHYLDFSEIYGRFNSMAVERENATSVSSRLMARAAAREMLADHAVFGVGAGCFRHLFPQYVRHYPKIFNGGRLFWEHAHDDWLEIPIELGVVGCLFLLAGAAWWARFFTCGATVGSPLAAPLLIGCGQTLLHAWMDFPLQCPAILLTWCALLTVAGRWIEAQ